MRRPHARAGPGSSTGSSAIAPAYQVNPLGNYWLGLVNAVVAIPVTWWLVERVVEPRLRDVPVDGDPELMPSAPPLTRRERHGLWVALAVAVALARAFAWVVTPAASPMRAPDGSLTGPGSPVMAADHARRHRPGQVPAARVSRHQRARRHPRRDAQQRP